MNYRLSVLDQSPIPVGSNAVGALSCTLDLARTCDRLGYHRYWMAEHHATRGLAGVAPEAMIGPVALATSRIRVGSGGIMLPHYSPFKVAETFALLSALAPGRIDLGIGRAAGGDARTAFALQRDRSRRLPSDDFPSNLVETMAYLDGTIPPDHPFAPLQATLPSGGGTPEVWLLGSSRDSAVWAAEAGLPYCIADFINFNAAQLAQVYRSRFRPGRIAEPYVMAATWTIAAPTLAEAQRQALPAEVVFVHFLRGEMVATPSVEEAEAWVAKHGKPPPRGRATLGTAAEVHSKLDEVAELYGADELMLVNILADHDARRRSYELVAAEYGIDRSPGAPSRSAHGLGSCAAVAPGPSRGAAKIK